MNIGRELRELEVEPLEAPMVIPTSVPLSQPVPETAEPVPVDAP